MGSPASVVIAEITLQHIEQIILDRCNSILFWFHYVDDIIASIPQNQFDTIFNNINSANPNIQFTAEQETDGCINFLDMKIRRSFNGYLSFSIYRKPTHTDKYLDFHSNHPNCHKESVVRSLYERAFKLCDDDFIDDETDHLSKVLKKNNYPKSMINKIKKTIINKQNSSSAIVSTNPRPSFASAPYIRTASERAAKLLKKYNIKLAHRPTAPLRNSLCKIKDKRSTFKSSGVVYQVNCLNCNAVYIGETGRLLEERISEHKRDIRNKKRESHIYMHTDQCGHNFDFNNTKILAKANEVKTRRKLEGICTHQNQNSLNRAWELNPIYNVLFNN